VCATFAKGIFASWQAFLTCMTISTAAKKDVR